MASNQEEICYLPQPQDEYPDEPTQEMCPVGPYASGQPDWSPYSGMTGLRPVVDKYSITRYSEADWRRHNKTILDQTQSENEKADLFNWSSKQTQDDIFLKSDKTQEGVTLMLKNREKNIFNWKCELEHAISNLSEEIVLVKKAKARVRQALKVLQIPHSIASECLDRRTGRPEKELVRDEVEEELIRELALTEEIKELLTRSLKNLESQQEENKAAKERLEYDWSDKKEAHEIERTNVALNNSSRNMMFKPGSVILPDNQSTPEFWRHFTEETLKEAEVTRQKSEALRNTIDSILTNSSRDLRSQANKVEMALAKRISCIELAIIRLKEDLKKTLQKIVDTEKMISCLKDSIRKLDTPTKKVQTRLDNRLERPRVENCRDEPTFGLLNEVKLLAEHLTSLKSELKQAELALERLLNTRGRLEKEIFTKQQGLDIDKKVSLIRAYYPSTIALSGY